MTVKVPLNLVALRLEVGSGSGNIDSVYGPLRTLRSDVDCRNLLPREPFSVSLENMRAQSGLSAVTTPLPNARPQAKRANVMAASRQPKGLGVR